MKQRDIIVYGSVAVGAYLAYWYVTNFGPSASVTWWDSWFGPATPPVSNSVGSSSAVVQNPQVQGQQAQTNSPQVQVPVTPQPANSLREQLLAASDGDAYFAAGVSDAFHWNWYRDRLTNTTIAADLMDRAFPGGSEFVSQNPITVDQYLAGLQNAGVSPMSGRLSGIPQQAEVAQTSVELPRSMSFGGMKGMPPMGGYKN